MEKAPWHAQQSYLSAGWYENNSYSTVLPNLQRLPQKEPLPELSFHTCKSVPPRSYSAEVCRKQRLDPEAEPFCRIRPLPTKDARPDRHLGECASPINFRVAPVEEVDSPFFKAAFNDEAKLTSLLAAAPGTECIRLPSHHWMSPEFLVSLGGLLPRLKELNLRNTRATDSVVASLAASCRNLRILDLGECESLRNISRVAELQELRELRLPRCVHAVTSEFVASLRSASKLEVLDLSFCPNFDSKGLTEMSTGCCSLRWLSLTSCRGAGDEGVLAVVSHNAGIEHLALALNVELGDHSTGKAIRCLKRLRHLDVSGCPQLFRQTPLAVAKYCENIEDVSFASCPDMGDEELKPLFMRCARLRSLDLTGCSSVSAELILEGLSHTPDLQKLVLTLVPSISDETMSYLGHKHANITFERHARRHMDPDDLSGVLRMPPKGSVLVTRSVKAVKATKKKGSKTGSAG